MLKKYQWKKDNDFNRYTVNILSTSLSLYYLIIIIISSNLLKIGGTGKL